MTGVIQTLKDSYKTNLYALRATLEDYENTSARLQQLRASEATLVEILQSMTDHPGEEITVEICRALELTRVMLWSLPMHVALSNYRHEFETLFEQGIKKCSKMQANVNDYLLCATNEDNTQLMQFFLSEGADVNHHYHEGSTLTHMAAIKGSVAGADLLLANGATVDAVNVDGLTPLHAACFNIKSISVMASMVRRLLQAGANEGKKCNGGFTPEDYVRAFPERGSRRRSTRVIRLLRQAAERRQQRRHCVWIAMLRGRAEKGAAVRPAKRRRSRRLQGELEMKAADEARAAVFLVHDAPDGVFLEIMAFLGMVRGE